MASGSDASLCPDRPRAEHWAQGFAAIADALSPRPLLTHPMRFRRSLTGRSCAGRQPQPNPGTSNALVQTALPVHDLGPTLLVVMPLHDGAQATEGLHASRLVSTCYGAHQQRRRLHTNEAGGLTKTCCTAVVCPVLEPSRNQDKSRTWDGNDHVVVTNPRTPWSPTRHETRSSGHESPRSGYIHAGFSHTQTTTCNDCTRLMWHMEDRRHVPHAHLRCICAERDGKPNMCDCPCHSYRSNLCHCALIGSKSLFK